VSRAGTTISEGVAIWLWPIRSRWLIDSGFGGGPEVGRIEIILSGDPDQREQRVAPRIGQRSAILCGAAVSLTGHTGQSEDTH
jgi:hypothetical protein